MKSERDINRLVEQVRVKASSRLDDRVHGEIDQASTNPKANTTPTIGRRIMISSLTKLGAAAAIILAVLIGLNVIETPSGSGIAWAQIPDRVASVDAFIFSCPSDVTGDASKPPQDHMAQSTYYLSEEHGFRMDINADGKLTSWYKARGADSMIVVIPDEKTWFALPIPEDQRGKLPEEYKDPADYIRRFMARPYKELGRSMIDGTEVEGVEVTDPPTDGEELGNAVGRMWVDVETELPVRVEIEGTAEGHAVQWLMGFKWSEAVDPAVFEPNIPSDYTLPLP